MASVTVLPALSQSWVAPDSPVAKSLARKSHSLLCPAAHHRDTLTPAVVQRKLIPAGSAYLAHGRRTLHGLSFDAYDKLIEQDRLRDEALRADGLNGEDDLGVGDEEESPQLSLLDPKEWKVCRCLRLSHRAHSRSVSPCALFPLRHPRSPFDSRRLPIQRGLVASYPVPRSVLTVCSSETRSLSGSWALSSALQGHARTNQNCPYVFAYPSPCPISI